MDCVKELIKQDTNITEEQLVDITNRKFDWILDSKQALELKVIDEIL
jgi:tRNA A37 threonylcarbamoyladenosine dehydratase